MESQMLASMEMRKFERTCLSRLVRLSKSFISEQGEEYEQFCLREILSKALKDYESESTRKMLNSNQTFTSFEILPLAKILHWNESVTGSKSKIKVDSGTSNAIDMLSRTCSLEGYHLTVNDDDLGYIEDKPTLYGSIALGLFLIHILALQNDRRHNDIEIISKKCQRFIKKGDHITVRLYLIRTNNDLELFPHYFWDSASMETSDVYDFTFSNKGLSIISGGIGKTRSHEFEIERGIPNRYDEVDR